MRNTKDWLKIYICTHLMPKSLQKNINLILEEITRSERIIQVLLVWNYQTTLNNVLGIIILYSVFMKVIVLIDN